MLFVELHVCVCLNSFFVMRLFARVLHQHVLGLWPVDTFPRMSRIMFFYSNLFYSYYNTLHNECLYFLILHRFVG